MEWTILRKSPWVDAALILGYNTLTHFLFAPYVWSAVNVAITGCFLAGQVAAIYVHILWALAPRLNRQIDLSTYFLRAGVALGLGLVIIFPLLSLVGLFVPEFGMDFGFGSYVAFWVPKVFWSTVTMLAITGAIHVFARRQDDAVRQQKLEKEQAKTELAYLRGQLNPHFLFNVLNSIHVLIRRDPAVAADALEGFSDLLRYQLYRAEEELVPIEEEVAQLRQFAALSRYRMEEDFVFRFRAPEHPAGRIPPLLLQPLLENAFKYNQRVGGLVEAELALAEDRLTFRVVNRIGAAAAEKERDAAGGIGLQNVRRRLELLYPGRYRLATRAVAGIFTAELEIPYV